MKFKPFSLEFIEKKYLKVRFKIASLSFDYLEVAFIAVSERTSVTIVVN